MFTFSELKPREFLDILKEISVLYKILGVLWQFLCEVFRQRLVIFLCAPAELSRDYTKSLWAYRIPKMA